MQIENNRTTSKKAIYSIDQYEGPKKWCFAIVLNRACDNYEDNPHLFSESLLRFEEVNRRDWFDEKTRELIKQADTEIQLNPNLIPNTPANRKLHDIRNYFSHFYHQKGCLYFKEDDQIRIIMEKTYEKARFEKTKKQQEDISVEFPEKLFEENGKITSAGVVFFVSFFVERRFLNRLMGCIQGFIKTEGEYNITRKVFSTYCLKDSYSIQAQEHDAVMFRDILGYLSRVPTESFQRIKQPQTQKEGQLSERKTDKFILFALNYLEDYGLKDLEGCKSCFARSIIVREHEDIGITDDKEYKPQENKKKVEIHFDQSKGDPFYINHNNVILRIQKKDEQSSIFKMGIYELKYLVLLSLLGKAGEAVEKIDSHLQNLLNQLPDIEKKNEQEIQEYVRFLPGFVRSHLGLLEIDDKEKIKARLDYVKKKWTDKKEKSRELELHRKGRDILRYINERCDRELNRNEYNRILELLVAKNLEGFYRELEELKKTERIDKNIIRNLSGQESLNALHEKVCDLVLAELESLEPEKLKEYIGLIPKEEKGVTFKEKVDRVLSQPVIYKGFLRYQFFKDDKKSFAKFVEDVLAKKGEGCDVPLGTEYYHIVSLDRFDKENKKLYETLAMDRLCLMMARQYYLNLNKKLAQKAQKIDWKKEDGREVIIFTFQNPQKPELNCSIKFSIRDYTKLYVTDESEFLARLIYYFFPKDKKEIEYHKLYTEGINKYTDLQKEGIQATLELERKIIERKNIKPVKNYLSFNEIMSKSGYYNDEQSALKKVRNALLHYNLNFEKEHLRIFYSIMKKGKIEKMWSLKV